MKMMEIKNTLTKIKNAVNGFINRLDTLRKRSLSLNKDQKKFPKIKHNDNKEWIKQQKIQKLWNHFKRYNIHVIGIHEEKKEQTSESNIWIMAKSFPS